MSNFKLYSEYYDLLYKDKDYEGEVEYIDKLIKKYQPEAKNIIDFGCGTGNHDKFLSEKGYSVLGVDLSENMIELAKDKNSNVNLDFKVGDIRTFESNKKYDVATALFHVMSYQISNEDLERAVITVKKHLNATGIFIFDFWYGPGVLTSPPLTRVKKLHNDKVSIIRISEPNSQINYNVVDVEFEVNIINNENSRVDTIYEKHSMRYLFYPEILNLMNQNDFKVLNFTEWMSDTIPDKNSWNAVVTCKLN
jgi:SAM-dependent methyltransferase